MDVVIGSIRAQHRSRRCGTLLLSIVEVLDTDPAEYRMKMVRDIPGGIDVGGAGPAQFVDQNTVILRDGLPCDGRDLGLNPDTSHGEVACHPDAASGRDRLQPLGPFERGNLVSGEQLNAVRAVNGTEYSSDFPAQHPLKRESARKDGGHVHPELRQRGRHLGADEAHAHYDRAPARHSFALDGIALSDRTQVVEARQVGPRKLEPPVPPTRGDQDLLVLQLLARAEEHRMRGGIDDRGTGPHETVHIVLLIPAGWPDTPAREILLGPQVRLGQRRPAKGDTRLLADNDDPVPVTLLPQGYGGVAPGHGGADDHDSGPGRTLGHLMHLPTPGPRETRRPAVSKRTDLVARQGDANTGTSPNTAALATRPPAPTAPCRRAGRYPGRHGQRRHARRGSAVPVRHG